MEKIITIDGPSASGKTALCRRISQRWGHWDWLSTGVFYRGLAYMILDLKLKETEEWVECIKNTDWAVKKLKKNTQFLYKGKDLTPWIYNMEMDQKASDIARVPEVRRAFIPYQRSQKESKRGLLAEGRDCGTAVFPNAGLKIYLTAQDPIRAQRRTQERNEPLDVVMSAQKQRDKRDSERSLNPLKKAESAWVVHTDQHSLDDIEDMVCRKAQTLFGSI